MKTEIFKFSLMTISFLALISCERQAFNASLYEQPKMTSETKIPKGLNDFPEIAKENNKDRLIYILDSADCVYSAHVGIASAYTDVYAAYERLLQISSKEELIKLTKHKSRVVKQYAYMGLYKIDSTLAEEIYNEIKKDTTPLCTFDGCIRLTIRQTE
ncbi:MAG: hypothetical protein ACXWDO_01150 [Bacteroidia bacterium]